MSRRGARGRGRGGGRRAVVLVVVVLAAAVLWVGWHVWRVQSELAAAADDAVTLQEALRVGDPAATSAAAGSLQEHAESAHDLTGGSTWSALGHVPGLGDDVRGVALLSEVLADVSRDGVVSLAEEASDLNVMMPQGGRIDVERLATLQEPVSRARESMAAAAARLGDQDTSGFLAPLHDRYEQLSLRVSDAAAALDAADRALRVLPGMLGADGPRSYLLVFQNNAEVRATGGLPGAVSIVNADDGRITLGTQTTGSQLGEAPSPVLPLTDAERTIYGPQLGTYFLDANFTPSFPRAAELMRARWEQVAGQRVDGVLAVDPVAVSYVLEVTGGVEVGPTTLTSGNVIESLLNQIYTTILDTDEQDELFKLAARTVFDRVVAGGDNPQGLITALGRGASEHRLLVHSFDPAEQERLAGTPVAGEHTSQSADGPQVGLYLNDNTGSKMSFYLRTQVDAEASACRDGVQTVTGVARFTSTAPEDAATALPAYVTGGGRYGIDPGTQLVALRIYGPVGGTIDEISLDGDPVEDLVVVDHDGRPVTTVYPYLAPQQVEEIGWTVTSGAQQAGDVVLSVTPGVDPRNASSVLPSAC